MLPSIAAISMGWPSIIGATKRIIMLITTVPASPPAIDFSRFGFMNDSPFMAYLGPLQSILETAGHALKSPQGLFERPLDGPARLVAIRQIVVDPGKAVRLTALFHRIQLPRLKPVLADDPPGVGRGIHREARRQRSIGADNHGVLSGPPVPRLH